MNKKIISKDNYDMDGRLISKSTYLVDEESEVTPEVSNGYQKLFNYMKNEHDVTLLVTDMDEIIRIVHGMQPTKTEPSRLEVEQDKREQFWKDAWLSVASAINCANHESATKWANAALQAYDELIKQSKQ